LKASYPEEAAVTQLGKEVRRMLESGGREDALRHAMRGADAMLRTPTDALRFGLREKVFKRFSTRGVSYQDNDFECVDYELYEIAEDLPLFRGPPVPKKALENGDYFCVMGAAQTFGRLVHDSWPSQLSKAIGLPVLNLSRGGAGPEFFLEPKILELASRARFVVIQALSGRSVGCEDYPGGRLVEIAGKQTKINRLALVKLLAEKDPQIALHYIHKWNANYFGLYEKIREAIHCPTLLIWISDRQPNAWNPEQVLKKPGAGKFPQLVGGKLYSRVAKLFDQHYEFLTGAINEQTISRITGQPCPYFGDGGKDLHSGQAYYPTNENNSLIAMALTPWARTVVESRSLPAADQTAPQPRPSQVSGSV
jgi:hypothetical protein